MRVGPVLRVTFFDCALKLIFLNHRGLSVDFTAKSDRTVSPVHLKRSFIGKGGTYSRGPDDHLRSTSVQRRKSQKEIMKIKSIKSVFSPPQITEYLECVGFVKVSNESQPQPGKFDATVENLHTITRLHILRFPFENTAMH